LLPILFYGFHIQNMRQIFDKRESVAFDIGVAEILVTGSNKQVRPEVVTISSLP
jgi:hypothetical protein